MASNLNPSANLAAARITWDFDTQTLIVLSQYGFEQIAQEPVGTGVYFTLADDDVDSHIFPTATPMYSVGESGPTATYIPLLAMQVLAPSVAPFDSRGKRILVVYGWSWQPEENVGPDAIPFSLVVTAALPNGA